MNHKGSVALAVATVGLAMLVPLALLTRAAAGPVGPPDSNTHDASSLRTYAVRLPLVHRNHALPPPPTALDVTLIVTNTASVARWHEPVTSGVPVPRSVNLTSLSSVRLLDANGQPVAAQFTPLARWGGAPHDTGNPVRWLLLDFQADVPANGSAGYRLVNTGGTASAYPTLRLTDSTNSVDVDTGVAQFSISRANGGLSGPGLGTPLLGKARSSDGQVCSTTGPVTVTVATTGSMRVSVHVQGAYRNARGTPLLYYTSRYWFYAGQPLVRLFHTVENNNPCPLGEFEQLQCHDIGSAGSVTVTDVSLVLGTSLGGALRYQAGGERAPAAGSLTANLLLYQDSSGSDYWNRYPTMTDWEGNPLDTRPRMQSYVSFRGYRTTLGATVVDSGDRSAGWLSVTGNAGTWSIGVRDFWQNFPKALRATANGSIEIGLFPDEFGPSGYGFNLRAGEHKTHEIILASPPRPSSPLLPGLFAQAPAQWYVESGSLGFTAAPDWTDWPEHEQYIAYQLNTAPDRSGFEQYHDNLLDAIQSTDFYGIFDYGDWPIDYEGYGVAPHNCKYDNDYGMWIQWARGGDARWFELAQAADRHFADVDILHNLHSPRHWGDGIVFGHSEHDEAGFTNPHRNRNSANPDTAWGVTGMLTAYYLTGYEKAYESALELADCIEYRLRNDEHLCSAFPSGQCNGAGYALDEGMYGTGCRAAANSLSMIVAAYSATADPRYLEVASALVDWARASNQPYIGGPTGQDQFLRPWQLNMYLRALAGYLEVRDQFSLSRDAGAVSSFLAYANWLHTYAWIELTPLTTGPRAAYAYDWWFDGRTGIPGDENDNQDPSINNWLLLGADVMAYAHHLTGNSSYLDWAARLFRTGSHDPWCEGCPRFYAECKETINSITFGHIFLYDWARR